MHILAIDDEQLAINALLNELKIVFPNAELHGEKSPNSAVKWAKNLSAQGETLSYAFLDIKMRGMNGLELARILKSIYPQVTLIFCTAYDEYALDAFGLFAKGYLMKPVSAKEIEHVLDEMVNDWRTEPAEISQDMRVQTFGHFEVFVSGVPLKFERQKAKELLAYLVDRHGASVTTEQIAEILWENEPYDRKLKNRTTATVTSLKNTLKAAGVEDILIKSWNHLALDTARIKCDAYDYEKGDAVAVNSFHGEYMVNYSWAEFTTGRYSRMEAERIKN